MQVNASQRKFKKNNTAKHGQEADDDRRKNISIVEENTHDVSKMVTSRVSVKSLMTSHGDNQTKTEKHMQSVFSKKSTLKMRSGMQVDTE